MSQAGVAAPRQQTRNGTVKALALAAAALVVLVLIVVAVAGR